MYLSCSHIYKFVVVWHHELTWALTYLIRFLGLVHTKCVERIPWMLGINAISLDAEKRNAYLLSFLMQSIGT